MNWASVAPEEYGRKYCIVAFYFGLVFVLFFEKEGKSEREIMPIF